MADKKPIKNLDDFKKLSEDKDDLTAMAQSVMSMTDNQLFEGSHPHLVLMTQAYNALDPDAKVAYMMATAGMLAVMIGTRAGDEADLREGINFFLNYTVNAAHSAFATRQAKMPEVSKRTQ